MESNVPPVFIPTSTPEIRTRDDFFRILEDTVAEIDGFVAREPAYPVWALLQRQLHAMREWTANGAEPTPEQRTRISIGLVAARELEPAPDTKIEDLTTRLHLLSYYWRHWPAGSVEASTVPPLLSQNHVAKTHAQSASIPRIPKWMKYPPPNMMILLAISLFLYVLACCLPALEFRNSDKPNDIMLGLRALTVGWSGIFAGVYAWYANPFWFGSMLLLFFRRSIPGAILAAIAVALAATTFGMVGRELPGDEGNVTRTTVIRLLPGCYVWMSSIAVLLLSVFFRNRN